MYIIKKIFFLNKIIICFIAEISIDIFIISCIIVYINTNWNLIFILKESSTVYVEIIYS